MNKNLRNAIIYGGIALFGFVVMLIKGFDLKLTILSGFVGFIGIGYGITYLDRKKTNDTKTKD